MRLPRWSIYTHRNDFMPSTVGCVLLLLSVPAFVLLVVRPDPGGEDIAIVGDVIFALGIAAGLGFLIFGIAICASPGTWTYRLTHGRIFRP